MPTSPGGSVTRLEGLYRMPVCKPWNYNGLWGGVEIFTSVCLYNNSWLDVTGNRVTRRS